MDTDKALRLEALIRQGGILHEQGRLDEAAGLYQQALELDSADFRPLYLLGVVALAQHRAAHAVELIGNALRLNPRRAAVHTDLGRAQAELGRYGTAIESYERAIALDPDNAAAHYSRGHALFELQRYEDALAEFERATALAPASAEAFNALGNAFYRLKRYEPARAAYDRALVLDPRYGGCYHNRGTLLNELKMYREAAADFERALEHQCDVKALVGMRLNVKMHMCDWTDFDVEAADLAARIESDEPAANPCIVMSQPRDAASDGGIIRVDRPVPLPIHSLFLWTAISRLHETAARDRV